VDKSSLSNRIQHEYYLMEIEDMEIKNDKEEKSFEIRGFLEELSQKIPNKSRDLLFNWMSEKKMNQYVFLLDNFWKDKPKAEVTSPMTSATTTPTPPPTSRDQEYYSKKFQLWKSKMNASSSSMDLIVKKCIEKNMSFQFGIEIDGNFVDIHAKSEHLSHVTQWIEFANEFTNSRKGSKLILDFIFVENPFQKKAGTMLGNFTEISAIPF
jgi:hypothetical protein